jgi:uncharacterized protein YndB with AHSA1/START domain
VTIEAQPEALIGRPPSDVFRALGDVEQFPEWLVASGVVRVHHLRIGQRIAGRATTLDGEVVALEPAKRFAVRARDKDGITIELEALLTPDGAATRLRWAVRIGLPLRYRLFESMAAPEVKRAAAADLERLKRRLEAVAS